MELEAHLNVIEREDSSFPNALAAYKDKYIEADFPLKGEGTILAMAVLTDDKRDGEIVFAATCHKVKKNYFLDNIVWNKSYATDTYGLGKEQNRNGLLRLCSAHFRQQHQQNTMFDKRQQRRQKSTLGKRIH